MTTGSLPSDTVRSAEESAARGHESRGVPAARGAGVRRLRERIWERLEGAQAQLAAAAEAEGQAVPALYEELMSLPEPARQAAVEREERFWTFALAQKLLHAAGGLLPASPRESLAWAELARGAALRIPAGRYPGDMRHELAAEVWQGLAEAHRHLGDLAAAGRALRQAERVMTGEGLGPHVRAAFCLSLGRLRWDEGRPEEALAALERSARLWQSLEDFDAESEALTEAGWIALSLGDLEEAREQLDLATRLVKPERAPGKALRAYHGLALACAELGCRAETEAVLAAARELYPLLPGSADRLAEAAEPLERSRRNLDLRFRPRQEAPYLELPWDQNVPENLEVTVERAGWLSLPDPVMRLLPLGPGDAVLLDPGPASLRLEPCREWVRGLDALPAGQREQAMAELRHAIWTLVTPDGALLLPPELLSLEPGEALVLQLQERGGSYRLFVFKDEPATPEGAA